MVQVSGLHGEMVLVWLLWILRNHWPEEGVELSHRGRQVSSEWPRQGREGVWGKSGNRPGKARNFLFSSCVPGEGRPGARGYCSQRKPRLRGEAVEGKRGQRNWLS